MAENFLYYGDNLDVLRRYVKDESVDLVYLDPPFNSSANYNVLFGETGGIKSSAQIQAFEDTWRWDESAARSLQEVIEAGGRPSDAMQAFRTLLGQSNMLAYLAMMAPRLTELRRALKPTGSIYLHCDPTASHYLKILMDAIFGTENYRNEVIWQRTNARSTPGRWPRIHDTILFYTKSRTFTFHPTQVRSNPAKLPHTLITGPDGKKYQTYELTAPGLTQAGESGKPWRGFDPSKWGRHWANAHAVMNDWADKGLIHWPKAKSGSGEGFPRRRDEKPFVLQDRMVMVGSVWTDIDRINQAANERLGYPTQKPEALLERIIRASSNEGDVVLDPFCGCGTAIAAAQKLGRNWIGIDVTYLAINLIKSRLQDAYGDTVKYRTIGEPVTVSEAAQLAKEDPYQFQWWALGLVGARPVDQKKGADKGIDGRLLFHDDASGQTKQVILSVKAGQNISVAMVRDLGHIVAREKAQIGVLITMVEPTGPMRAEVASGDYYESAWGKHPRLQILTIAELLAGKRIDMPPSRAIADHTFRRAPKAKPAGETLPMPLTD